MRGCLSSPTDDSSDDEALPSSVSDLNTAAGSWLQSLPSMPLISKLSAIWTVSCASFYDSCCAIGTPARCTSEQTSPREVLSSSRSDFLHYGQYMQALICASSRQYGLPKPDA